MSGFFCFGKLLLVWYENKYPNVFWYECLYLSLKSNNDKPKKMKQLTEQEEELIEAIRNFKNSKHNPSVELELYIRQMFEELLYPDED